jgi:dipeptidyl aminopeptidase/acylaminoacyl peptidase
MQPFTPDDLYLHQKLMDLHCRPGLETAFGTVRSVLRKDNTYASQIWSFPLDGSSAGASFTNGSGLDQSPRLSPATDQLAFMSDRSGGVSQLFLMPLGGGEARQLGGFASGVSSFRWAPDGKKIYVSAAASVEPDLRGGRGDPPPQSPVGAPEVCWRLPYKSDGVGYLLKREIHVYSIDVARGHVERLTDGPFDVMGFEPSADGTRLAYTRTRGGRYAHCTDLWICDSAGRDHRRLTYEQSTVMQPVWSGDGRWIAFAGSLKEGDGESRLWLLERATGKVQLLGDLEVADPETLAWSQSCDSITLVRANRGRHEIVSVSVPGGEVKTIVGGDRQFGSFAVCGSSFLYGVDTPISPSELFVCGPAGKDERQLSNLNPWWRERPAMRMEPRYFDVPDGEGGTETIEGWLLRTADKADGPVPLLNDVHGGPAAYALLDYDTNVYWHALCSKGWAVLLLNAVGSSSFGGDFCKRLSGHWGELDLPQHMAAIEQLQHEGVCDDRVGIIGKSYGGFFTSWAIGHTPMFKAAVVMAPVGNIETHYGTSDGGYYADPLYIATAPGFDRKKARALSPLQHIEKATTPTLFLQGKDDERCPKCQSEELFVSLYRAGDTPAELVLYPGETHKFLGEGKPDCRADAARRIIDWVGEHITQASATVETARAKTPEAAADKSSAGERQPAHAETAEAHAEGDAGG